MWIGIFITLALCYGALAKDDHECQLRAEKSCQIHSIFPTEFPRNEEDLRRDCSYLNTVKQCIAETIEKCNLEDDDDNYDYYDRGDDDKYYIREQQRVKDMQRLVDVTTQICDENSELHRSFVPYLSCVRSTVETENELQSCRDYTRNALEFLDSRIESKARSAGKDRLALQAFRRELISCLRVLFAMNCFIDQSTKNCDAGVKQPILEIIDKGGSLYYQCPATSRIDIIQLLDDLQLVTRNEIYVKDLIRVDSFL